MSATGRAHGRLALDDYFTPAWCVHRLIEAVPLPYGRDWIECAAGTGSIIRACSESIDDATGSMPSKRIWQHGTSTALPPNRWTAYELDGRHYEALKSTGARVHIGDFLTLAKWSWFDYGISNTPYGLNEAFIARLRRVCLSFSLLLPLNFLASKKRREAFAQDMPDVAVLPDRPSFVVKVTRKRDGRLVETSSDNRDYGWFTWPETPRRKGEVFVLEETPADVLTKAKSLAPRIEVDECGVA